jgi:glycosyltransferase involved in cell wall biosynthesis
MWTVRGAFDVVVMIDVFEHIPGSSRRNFNRVLAGLLRDEALVLLSFPSAAHQLFLAEHDPDGLQPVDETITEETLDELARDLGGHVVMFEPVTVWNPSDYVHAVIQKGRRAAVPARASGRSHSMEHSNRRYARAKERLGIRVTKDGYLLPARPGPPILVVSPNRHAYSETFIKAQIEGLPTRVEVLFGLPPDAEDDRGRRLVPRWARGLGYVARPFVGPRLERRLNAIMIDRFVTSRGIEAVLAEFGPTGAALMGLSRRRSIPLITYFYGYDASERGLLERLRVDYAKLLNGASTNLAVSRDLITRLEDLGAIPGSIGYLPCGVDIERFSGAEPAKNPPTFVAVGRFVDKKAPHLTLLAFQRVQTKVPDAQLLMVGDGPLLGACQQIARAMGLGESVRFLGPRPHRDLAELMQGARAFVQHSITAASGDSEGTPVAILEAGAAGLPTVSTRHGGIPEVVIDGATGFLVDEGDVDAMAERMTRLAEDPQLAGRLGAQARTHVAEHFALAMSLERLWDVIGNAILRGPSGREPNTIERT